MRPFKQDDFEKMSKEIVDDFLSNKAPLESGVVRVATNCEMNPDQIRTLVQLANSMAHLALFERKNDGDKNIEFRPADPFKVLKTIYNDENPVVEDANDCCETSTDKAMDFFGDFPNLINKIKNMASLDGTPVETTNSSTDDCGESCPSSHTSSPEKKQMLIIKIRKVASELESNKMGAAYDYKEDLDKLASEFAKLYGPSHEDFEKDAFSICGEDAFPVLNDIRHCLHLPTRKSMPLEKLARVVDGSAPEIKALKELVKHARAYTEWHHALEYLKKEVGHVL